MFLRLLSKSLLRGAGASASSLAQLTAGALLATLFLTITLDVREKMTKDLREGGANALIATSRSGEGFERAIEHARAGGARVAHMRARAALVADAPLLVVAADPGELAAMAPYWSVVRAAPGGKAAPGGGVPASEGAPVACLIGRRAAERAKAGLGSTREIAWTGPGGSAGLGSAGTAVVRVEGIFESGDEDEGRIFVDRSEIAGRDDFPADGWTDYALAWVPGGEAGIEALAPRLAAEGAAMRPLRQVVETERIVLEKVTLLTAVALAAVLVLGILGVSAEGLARVVERRKEISLLRAIGATRESVAVLLLSEMAVVGMLAGLLGFLLGSAAAAGVTYRVFHVWAWPRMAGLAVALAVGCGVSLASAAAGVARAFRTEPAPVLRGE